MGMAGLPLDVMSEVGKFYWPWTLLQQIFVEYNLGKKFKFISNINGWDFLPDISNKCKRLSWKPGYFFQVVLFLDSYQRPRGEGWKKYKQQWPIFFDKLKLASHRRMRIVMDQSLSAVVCNHISLQCVPCLCHTSSWREMKDKILIP